MSRKRPPAAKPDAPRDDRETRIDMLTHAIQSAAAIGQTIRTRQAMDLLKVSRPTALADLREAYGRLGLEMPAADAPPPPLPGDSREKRVVRLVEALQEAAAHGRTFETRDAVRLLGVARNTAALDLKAARGRMTASLVQEAHAELVAVAGPHVTVEPMPRSVTVERAQAIATGVDMMGILARVGDDLDRVVREVGSDLEQVRFWLMGGDAGHQLPGRCITCNQQVADRINRQTPPALIGNLGVNDLGRMYDSLIKALRALTEVAAEKNAVLEQFYHYQALQNFMGHTEQAIKEIAPHLAVAIAKRVRELGERA